MLKSVCFKNQVHFRDFQCLNFSKGLNLLIGGNGTGKSVVLELIRRCLSVSASTTRTKPYETSEESFAICKFKVDHIPDVLADSECILSGFYKVIESVPFWVKFVIYIDNENEGHCVASKYLEKGDYIEFESACDDRFDLHKYKSLEDYLKMNIQLANGWQQYPEDVMDLAEAITQANVYKQIHQYSGRLIQNSHENQIKDLIDQLQLSTEEKYHNLLRYSNKGTKNLSDLIQDVKKDEILQNILKEIEDLKKDSDEILCRYPRLKSYMLQRDFTHELKTFINGIIPKFNNRKDKCNDILTIIEKRHVGTFSMRSIGPLQWSKSKSINIEYKTQNYKTAVERAEIITALFPESKHGNCQFQDMLDSLTYPKKCHVQVSSSNGKTEITIDDTPLLKTPEGILEAIQFALIMTQKYEGHAFETICLEEPDRGMHSEMVERLRDLPYSDDQVVIIVSHNQTFLNYWTASKTHVCVRKPRTSKKRDTTLKAGPSEETMRMELQGTQQNICQIFSLNEISTKIADSDDMKKLLFSTRILCVEGPSDRRFVESVIDFLRTNEKIKLEKTQEQAMLSFQVICLNSCTFEETVRNFCSSIDLPCAVILDRDAKIRMQEEGKGPRKITKIAVKDGDKIFQSYIGKEINEDFLEKGFKILSDILKKDNIFSWKYGALENTIKRDVPNEVWKEIVEKNKTLKKEKGVREEKSKKEIDILLFDRTYMQEIVSKMFNSSKTDKEIDRLCDFLRYVCEP